MVPNQVRKPCMEHILELLKQHGLEDVIVTVAFMPQAIRSYFGSGDNLGLNVEYSVEESPLGTAGSVRLPAGGWTRPSSSSRAMRSSRNASSPTWSAPTARGGPRSPSA